MEKISTSIMVGDDGNVTAFELAEKLREKGYEIELPDKEKKQIEFGDLMYHGKKLINVSFTPNVIMMFLEENGAHFTLEFE